MKIAIIRLAEVVSRSRQGVEAEKKLQARTAELDKSAADKERIALKAEAGARGATDHKKAEALQLEAGKLRREAQHHRAEVQIEIDALRRDLLHTVLNSVEPLIREVAQETGIDLVQIAPNPGIAYFAPEIDITDQIVERLNRGRGGDKHMGRSRSKSKTGASRA